MDIISMILSRNGINRLKASGGVGYSDGGGSLKFNDDFDSTVYLEAFRRVTDKTYKVDAIKSITLRDTEEESTIAPQGFIDLKGDGSIYVESSEAIFIVYKQAEMEGGTVLPVGTYFTHIESAEVLSIEFTETIHPIDPKYIPQIPAEKLPGAVLPVVELSTIPTVEGAQLTEMEVAAIKATEGMPFIGKFQLDIAGTGTPIPFFVIFTGVVVDEMVFFEAETYIGVRLIFNIGKPSNSGVENTFSYRLAE